MTPFPIKLPIVKASEVQKNFRKIVEEVEHDGYRFVVNRGNPCVVIISMALYTEKFSEKVPSVKKRKRKMSKIERNKIIDKAAGIWKHYGQTWQEILKEIRAQDKNKTDAEFIKELLEWQEKNI